MSNRYHINHEGKVYPCRTRVRKCPYGDDMHSDTQEELHYKVLKINRDIAPAKEAEQEISVIGRMKSLNPASKFISQVSYPVEVAISTLNYAIERSHEISPEGMANSAQRTFERGVELTHHNLAYGLQPEPDVVPSDIMAEAKRQFMETDRGRVRDFAGASRNKGAIRKGSDLYDMKDEFESYKAYKKWGLTEENAKANLAWLKEDFLQFSHDLNTSKMITQPVFYGDIDKAEETIKAMDNYELLAAYDDYLTPDEEIQRNVELANNFDYQPRNDLTTEANDSMKRWYDRNKKVFENWQNNTPKRVLLSVKMANELDKRGIYRQDNAIGR